MGHSISDGPDKLGDSSSWQYRSSIFPLNVQETKPRIPTYTVTNLQLQNCTTQTANRNCIFLKMTRMGFLEVSANLLVYLRQCTRLLQAAAYSRVVVERKHVGK